MNQNLSTLDRLIRIMIGLGIISLAFVGPQSAWGWFGLFFIASGLVSWCPLYNLLGVSTRIPIQYTWKQH